MYEEKLVDITEQESSHLEELFNRFNGYVGILAYLVNNQMMDENNPFLKDKWEECVRLSFEVEQTKRDLDAKYHPQDGIAYTNFEFDFYHHQIIYRVG